MFGMIYPYYKTVLDCLVCLVWDVCGGRGEEEEEGYGMIPLWYRYVIIA